MFLSSSSHLPAENVDDFDDDEDGDGDAADKELADEGICTITLQTLGPSGRQECTHGGARSGPR